MWGVKKVDIDHVTKFLSEFSDPGGILIFMLLELLLVATCYQIWMVMNFKKSGVLIFSLFILVNFFVVWIVFNMV